MRAVYAFVVAFAMLAFAPLAEAQTKVQGVSPVTSAAVAWPVMVAGVTPSGTVGYVNIDAAGNLILNGIAPTSSSTAVSVNTGINPTTDTLTPQGEISSNGTTNVVIAAASSGKRNYLVLGSAENISTTNLNTVRIVDQVTGKILARATLSPAPDATHAGGQAFWTTTDMIVSSIGSALVFKLTAANGTDVTFTATTVTK